MKTRLLSLSPAEFCKATDACSDGVFFAAKHASMAEVWDACPRIDWLIWMLNAIDAPQDEKTCRLFMVWCARNTPLADGRTTGALITDARSLAALEVAERFANCGATRQELFAAGVAAWAATGDAAGAAARVAARAAAWDATWAAARAAAGAAAWDAQAAQFRKVVANPFKL